MHICIMTVLARASLLYYILCLKSRGDYKGTEFSLGEQSQSNIHTHKLDISRYIERIILVAFHFGGPGGGGGGAFAETTL